MTFAAVWPSFRVVVAIALVDAAQRILPAARPGRRELLEAAVSICRSEEARLGAVVEKARGHE